MNTNFTKLFIKFFMPYLLIITIMFALSSIVYFAAFREIENNAIKMQESYMEQSKSVIDRRFKEAIDASIQLTTIPIVEAFKAKSREDLDKNYFVAYELYDEITNIRFVNDIIEEYLIFYKKSEIVAMVDQLNYYNTLPSNTFDASDYSKQEFWNLLFKDYYKQKIIPAQNYKLHGRNVVGIPILTTIGYNVTDPEAVILMILNGDKLKENMIGFEENLNGNFIILNSDNQVLISLNDSLGVTEDGYVDIDGLEQGFMTFSSSSDRTDWKYMLIQPEEEVFREITKLRSAGQVLIIIIFLVGLLVSLISARYNSKPVHTLINDHEALSARLNDQRPYLRRTFLERWLKGNYTHIEEIISITKYLRAQYIGEFYAVMVIDYDERINVLEDLNEYNIKELEIRRLILKDLLTEELIKPEYMHDIDHDKIAVIYIWDGLDELAFQDHISKQIDLCRAVLVDNDIEDVLFGVGNIYKEMEEVSLSLSNAIDALATISSNSSDNIVHFSDLEENIDNYYYPPELETRLFNCTRAGDSEQVSTILRNVLKRNVFEKTLAPHMLKVFIYEIWGTLAKVQERAVGENNAVKSIINDAFEQIEVMSDLEKIQYCRKIFLDVSEVIRLEKADKHDNVMENINEYIKENFVDPDFCLPMVAEKFNLSYAYLSQIFKDFNDESFINYLQQLRMKEAERLLVETNLPVKDIVTASGYNSSNTFGKAFKRMHGVSASVYRDKQKQ